MKKSILLFLFSISIYSQTYTDVSDLIDLNLASGNKITAVKHRAVEHAILDYVQQNIAQSGDIKRVKCDLAYITANFEINGLGKNLRQGWAICNGNNGTDDLAGRVGVGYGLGWSVLGQVGGSKDAVVVAHSHTVGIRNHTNSRGAVGLFDQASQGANQEFTSSTTGVSGTDRNMQPYIINLYIMKL